MGRRFLFLWPGSALICVDAKTDVCVMNEFELPLGQVSYQINPPAGLQHIPATTMIVTAPILHRIPVTTGLLQAVAHPT